MREKRFRGVIRLFLPIALLAVIGAALAASFPPRYFHFGGSDASNYTNTSALFAYQHSSASLFYPSETSPSDYTVLDATFTDLRGEKNSKYAGVKGLMSPYTFVSADHRVMWPHFHLYPSLMAIPRIVGLPDVAEYLNYFSTVAFSIVLFLIFKRLHFETPVALFAASAVFALPSYIAGARYPLSEATASLLQAGMVLSFLTARSSTDWKPYVCLIALTWCRAEFLACSLISIAYLSLMAPTRRTLWILLLLSFNHILLYTYYQWANLGHINLLRVPLTLGLLSPSIVLLGWLARRTFDRLKFRPLNVRRLLRQLKPSVAILTFAFLVAFVVALDAIRMGHLDVLGAPEITGSRPRYSTVSLLVDSVGLPLIVLGIAGLAMSFPKIVRHIPIPLAIVLAPQLVVLVDMHATPSNPFYWTRRFHLLVYPMLLFGLATSAHFIFKRFRDAKLGVLALPLSLFFLSSTVHASQDFFERATKASFTRESLAQFHRSADRLPEDAIVVLRRKHGGYEAQQPLRAFHGLWSFVVWDDEHLAESVRALSKTGRPVLVDTTLLSAAEQSHAADQVFELPVRISAQNHFILELMPATRVAAADPGSPMLLRTHE